jgi:hypothetical protein
MRWKVFMTTAWTPHRSRSVLSNARTTPSVASGKKTGNLKVP